MNDEVTAFWDRLSTAQLPGEGYSAFARRLGVPVTTLSSLKSGTLPRIDTAAQIAGALDVSVDWLLGREANVSAVSKSKTDMIMVPVIDAQPSAGNGSIIEAEPVSGVIALRRDLVRSLGVSSAGALRVLEARGNSMEPTIRAGDLILIDTAIDRIIDESVYIFRFGGALVVKRVRFSGSNSVELISDNGGGIQHIPEADLPDLHAAGRVVRVIRAL